MGAVIGANLRYFVNRFSLRYLSSDVPYGTFIVNLTGSFILGFSLLGAWGASSLILSGVRLLPLDSVVLIPPFQALVMKLML